MYLSVYFQTVDQLTSERFSVNKHFGFFHNEFIDNKQSNKFMER